ncbi:MAG: putative membrane protein [Crocinitomix sp.]|jgi:putative membrane protein
MIVKFSSNPVLQLFGIAFWNIWLLFFYALFAGVAFVLCHFYEYHFFELPPVPVSILGGALAIFLGFKNSSAYDRWWEARKIWGSIVNDSRSLGMEINTYCIPKPGEEVELDEWKKRTTYRHIGWLYALRSLLRSESHCEVLKNWVNKEDGEVLSPAKNVPAQLILIQAKDVSYAFEKGWIEQFRFKAYMSTLKKMYDNQGKCERIKNTVFPFYYNYFTNLFLWLFTVSLPFALASEIHTWVMIPVSIAISFAFAMLNKSGQITENPFEGRAADTPITTIVRGIEIDLLQMLEESDLPDPEEEIKGRFGVIYKK